MKSRADWTRQGKQNRIRHLNTSQQFIPTEILREKKLKENIREHDL